MCGDVFFGLLEAVVVRMLFRVIVSNETASHGVCSDISNLQNGGGNGSSFIIFYLRFLQWVDINQERKGTCVHAYINVHQTMLQGQLA
jgi:hypothetical protein